MNKKDKIYKKLVDNKFLALYNISRGTKMKELTKQIRKDVKEMIIAVGGTENLTNSDVNRLFEKYCPDWATNWSDRACKISTTIHNQIDYFKFAKQM